MIPSRPFLCFCVAFISFSPWLLDSAVFAHFAGAAYELGYFLPHDEHAAFRWYRKAAMKGDALAAFQIGAIYYLGAGIPMNPQAAAYWWRRGAELGDASAQAATGDAYCLGIGVSADGIHAQRWWRMAAQQGDLHAINMLRGPDCTGGHHLDRARVQLEI